MKTCPFCGKENSDGNRFCEFCGSSFENAPTEEKKTLSTETKSDLSAESPAVPPKPCVHNA